MAHIELTTEPLSGPATRRLTLDSKQTLDRFLSGVEKRALVMARMATGNVDEAMDIVQDAMLQLVRYYSRRNENEWPPLFHRILQRRIFDWYRRNRVRNRWRYWFSQDDESDEDPLAKLPDPAATNPADAAATGHTLTALETAVAQLPLRQRQAFLLRAWEGLDTEQTARAMQCSQGSVKTHYSRAIQALKQRLKDHWE